MSIGVHYTFISTLINLDCLWLVLFYCELYLHRAQASTDALKRSRDAQTTSDVYFLEVKKNGHNNLPTSICRQLYSGRSLEHNCGNPLQPDKSSPQRS